MARGLTVRTLGKLRTFCEKLLGVNNSLLENGKGMKTEIYIDAATMVLWAKSTLAGSGESPALNRMAYEVVAEWTNMVANLLRLQTSDKNVFIPEGPAAGAALRGCQKHYCTASIDPHAVDLGVDTVAGGKRDASKFRGRATSNSARAGRGNVVLQTLRSVGAGFQHLKKAAGLSNQGMAKSHAYGVSAVGVDPKTTSAQKINMGLASGVLHK